MMTLNDVNSLIGVYLTRDHPPLADAVKESSAFLYMKQQAGLVHAYSARAEYTRLGSPGMIIDIQLAGSTVMHQLFFSEGAWMQVSAIATSAQVDDFPDAISESEEDAFDRSMKGFE